MPDVLIERSRFGSPVDSGVTLDGEIDEGGDYLE
jgi:hypothetical protein